MFIVKQVLQGFLLPPLPWILALLAVWIGWQRRWARTLLLATIVCTVALHHGAIGYWLRYPLESRYAPLVDPLRADPYDAIVVLTGTLVPASGLIPFPTVGESMFRRLDEAWRLYRLRPMPIIVSGGYVNLFTPAQQENQIACDYLLLWGIRPADVIAEPHSRDTFESALAVHTILQARGWHRYLLVTSAVHMPRSMLAFHAMAPEPIAAPGDYTLGERRVTPLSLFPSEGAGAHIGSTLHEYLGLANYYWRIHTYQR
jgi:uncharacterized SAM-binding protein YcdF (DUF218 family)